MINGDLLFGPDRSLAFHVIEWIDEFHDVSIAGAVDCWRRMTSSWCVSWATQAWLGTDGRGKERNKPVHIPFSKDLGEVNESDDVHDVPISVEKWILLWVVKSCSQLLYSIPCLFTDCRLMPAFIVAVDLFQVSVLSRSSRPKYILFDHNKYIMNAVAAAKLSSPCPIHWIGLAFTPVTCTNKVANPLATAG